MIVEPPLSNHPKCDDLVVAYKNQTSECFFQSRSRFIDYFRDFIALSKLSVHVVPCCYGKLFVYCEWRSTYS